MSVGLRQAKHGQVEAAAVVKVELVRLIEDGGCVAGGTEIESACRHAANHAGFGGHRHRAAGTFFGSDDGYPFRHADAEVHHRIRFQFERRAPGNDLARIEAERLQAVHRNADFAGIGRVVVRAEGLHVVGRVGHHDAVDKDAGHLDLARRQGVVGRDAFDLGNHQATAVVGSHRDGQAFEGERLVFHGQIAVGVGGGRADEGHVDREGRIEQVVLVVDLHAPDDIDRGARVELAAVEEGIDEGAEADTGQVTRPAGGNVAEHMGDHALWQVVAFHEVVDGHAAEPGGKPPVPADDPLHQPFVRQVIQPLAATVALTGGIHQGQVARRAVGKEALLQRHGDFLGKTNPHETGRRKRGTVLDAGDGGSRSHDLGHGNLLWA